MTIFHKIISKEIPADIIMEDDDIVAFRDNSPVAPVHVLVVPKVDIESVGKASETDADILGKVLLACQKVAKQEGILESGFRIVLNNGEGSGQTVFQLHAHVIGGRDLKWPPG